MATPTILACDGCGQRASGEHIARRLQRLEWATRFRPIHMQALLLASTAPESDGEFLYSPEAGFAGLAEEILTALEIPARRPHEEALAEFQKRGLYLAYALECPVERDFEAGAARELLERHLPQVIARIRRSLKPKRVLVVSRELQVFLAQLTETSLGCPDFYAPLVCGESGKTPRNEELAAFSAALSALAAHGK